MKPGSSLGDKLKGIEKKRAKFLTFHFRQPIQAMLESSQVIANIKKQRSYGICYLSVLGCHVNPVSDAYKFLMDSQKDNSLEVMSKFFSGEFTEAFELIAEQPEVITKIKGAFDKLVSLLEEKADLIKPIFLALCSKNEDLGEWIMMNRLLKHQDSVKKEQIKFLGDIISSNYERQHTKLQKLQ